MLIYTFQSLGRFWLPLPTGLTGVQELVSLDWGLLALPLVAGTLPLAALLLSEDRGTCQALDLHAGHAPPGQRYLCLFSHSSAHSAVAEIVTFPSFPNHPSLWAELQGDSAAGQLASKLIQWMRGDSVGLRQCHQPVP